MRGAVALKLGSLAVLAGALGYWGWKAFFDRPGTYRVWGLYRNTVGLVDNSRVRVAGIQVGRIVSREIVTVPAPPGSKRPMISRAKVVVELDRTLLIYEDAVMKKTTAATLGEFYIEIIPGTPVHPRTGKVHRRLDEGDQVPQTDEPKSLDEVMQEAAETLPKLRKTLDEIDDMTQVEVRKLLSGVRNTVEEKAEMAGEMLVAARQRATEIRDTIEDKGPEIQQSIERLREATRDINKAVDKGGRVEQALGDFDEELRKVREATDRFDKRLAEVDAEITKVNQGEGDVGKLLKDPTLAEDVLEVTEGIDRSIRGLFGFHTVVGLRTEYNAFAATLKTYFAVQFQMRPDKYYLLELVSDPRGFRRETIAVSQSSDPRRPATVSEKRVEITDQFRFTLQWAKRVGFWTGRFGIKESTGGLGSDLHFLRDRLEVSLDLFDFRANVYPRLKVAAAYQFFKYLYLVAGYDDLLNQRTAAAGGTGRDYFIGAMLRFDDEDLKGLLLMGGGTLASFQQSGRPQRTPASGSP